MQAYKLALHLSGPFTTSWHMVLKCLSPKWRVKYQLCSTETLLALHPTRSQVVVLGLFFFPHFLHQHEHYTLRSVRRCCSSKRHVTHTQSGARTCQQWPSDINAPRTGRKASAHLTATAGNSPAAMEIMNKVENKVFKRVCLSWNEPATTSFEKWLMSIGICCIKYCANDENKEWAISLCGCWTLVLMTYFTRVAKKMIVLLPTVFLSLDVLHCVL